jgi:hypothetical protein
MLPTAYFAAPAIGQPGFDPLVRHLTIWVGQTLNLGKIKKKVAAAPQQLSFFATIFIVIKRPT